LLCFGIDEISSHLLITANYPSNIITFFQDHSIDEILLCWSTWAKLEGINGSQGDDCIIGSTGKISFTDGTNGSNKFECIFVCIYIRLTASHILLVFLSSLECNHWRHWWIYVRFNTWRRQNLFELWVCVMSNQHNCFFWTIGLQVKVKSWNSNNVAKKYWSFFMIVQWHPIDNYKNRMIHSWRSSYIW
jgi:hypothetical protein